MIARIYITANIIFPDAIVLAAYLSLGGFTDETGDFCEGFYHKNHMNHINHSSK